MTTFTARGELGTIPAGIWIEGSTRFAYLDVGEQRIDDVWVVDYIVSNLNNSVGEEVELSFCRFKKRAVHLAAIKKSTGKIERIPDQSPFLFKEMLVAALVWGVVTFLSTWFIAPALIAIPMVAAKAVLLGLGEKVLALLVLLGYLGVWALQLIWILFYSKKLSPKIRLQVITKARTALD